MTEFGEENTILEILAAHDIHGARAVRLQKHIYDWIRGSSMIVQLTTDNLRSRDLVKKLENVLLAEPIHPTWGGGGDAA